MIINNLKLKYSKVIIFSALSGFVVCAVFYFIFLIGPVYAANRVELRDSGNNVINTFTTIQECVDVVSAGQTCLIYSGTYDERITFQNRIYGTAGNKVVIEAQTPRTVTMNGFNTEHADYLIIKGFDITGTSYGSVSTLTGIYIDSNDVEIINNYIYDVKYDGISTAVLSHQVTNVIIKDNLIYRCVKGIEAKGYNILVENNEINKLYDWYSMDPGGNNGANWTHYDNDYSRFFGDGITFKNNYFHGTSDAEVGTSHTDCFQTYHENNLDPNAVAYNVTLDSNICYYFDQGVQARDKYEENTDRGASQFLQNWTIKNNIFGHGFGGGGIMINANNVPNQTIVNNIFFVTWSGNSSQGLGVFNEGKSGIVKNNIFYKVWAPYYTGDDLQAGYNIIYEPGRYKDPQTELDLWKVDPLFADITNNDFRLCAGANTPTSNCAGLSPGVDAGTSLSSSILTDDIEGTSRPQGSAWDIGAYEYASGQSSGEPNPCTESWFCADWSACQSSSTQTRTCSDVNSCGTTTSKPSQSQSCTYTQSSPSQSGSPGSGSDSSSPTPASQAQDGTINLNPGWLVKNNKFAEVFFVDHNFKLRWIRNEKSALKHFGSNWNQIIGEYDDLNQSGLEYGDEITENQVIDFSDTKTSKLEDLRYGWLVKNKKFSEVFYVTKEKILRWIRNEQTAQKYFGRYWNLMIREFEDINVINPSFGDSLE